MTANETFCTSEEVTVYIKELNMFVTVQLLEDSPTVLSLERLCVESGDTYEWTLGVGRKTMYQCWSLEFSQRMT